MFTPEALQTAAEVIFGFFVLVTLSGAVLAVSANTLIRRVAGLALCFTGVAGIYYFLSSPFVAFMQMLIYVGAVCVTIALAIMLAETSDADRAPRKNPLAVLTGTAVSCAAAGALMFFSVTGGWRQEPASSGDGSIERIGHELLSTYSMSFELISVVLLVAMVGALALARRGRDKQ